MTTWSADQYLLFRDERTLPCRDLADRILLEKVERAVDLGCGAGTSTMVLAGRWPDASLTGLDSSSEMIDVARKTYKGPQWIQSDIAGWADAETGTFDLVFSNAAIHWVPNHEVLYPRLLARVADGGALAIQRPINTGAPVQAAMRDLASTEKWRNRFTGRIQQWRDHEPSFYYDLLARRCRQLTMWQTDYFHVMRDAESIVEWYKGSGLRPTLNALASDEQREEFLADYLEIIRSVFPRRIDGQILFAVNRSFLIAYR